MAFRVDLDQHGQEGGAATVLPDLGHLHFAGWSDVIQMPHGGVTHYEVYITRSGGLVALRGGLLKLRSSLPPELVLFLSLREFVGLI